MSGSQQQPPKLLSVVPANAARYVPSTSNCSLIVAVRVRPLLKQEVNKAAKPTDILRVLDDKVVLVLDPDESKVGQLVQLEYLLPGRMPQRLCWLPVFRQLCWLSCSLPLIKQQRQLNSSNVMRGVCSLFNIINNSVTSRDTFRNTVAVNYYQPCRTTWTKYKTVPKRNGTRSTWHLIPQ